MAILREVDLFGRVINTRRPPPGSQETLKGLGQPTLVIRVRDENILDCLLGRTVAAPNSPVISIPLYITTYSPFILKSAEINNYDIRGGRNLLGLRTSYRWAPSLTQVDAFIEATTHDPKSLR